MKVVHLSTFDSAHGGARSAYRLHCALRKRGVDSSMLVREKQTDDRDVTQVVPSRGWLARCRRAITEICEQRIRADISACRREGSELFSDSRTAVGKDSLAQLPVADVLLLHWITRFVDIAELVPAVSQSYPLVWRPSDMNPFTGGCHYNDGCDRFEIGCGKCPQLGSDSANDLSAWNWQRKKRALDQLSENGLVFVAQSRWLLSEMARSPILRRFRREHIANGIDLQQTRPLNRQECRRVLDLPEEGAYVLCLADSLQNRRKGMKDLSLALSGLSDISAVKLIAVGARAESVDWGVSTIKMGEVEDDRLLRIIYGAADVVAVPSLQDNLPNSAMESLACGRPVVGFDVGGMPDMVVHGENGMLAALGDVGALASGMNYILKDSKIGERMGRRSREVAEERFDVEVQVERYEHLLSETVMTWRNRL